MASPRRSGRTGCPVRSSRRSQGSWSATSLPPSSGGAWAFNFDGGGLGAGSKDAGFYALAVSPGDVGAVPEAQTYALMLAGLGLIGWRARRRG